MEKTVKDSVNNSAGEDIIEVKNLRKTYKNVKAVDGIDLKVKKQEILAILGPNGAGKTTTVEMLEGLRKPTGGEIYYFGEHVKVVDEKIKERIGVQLQKSTFFKNLKVKEIITAFGGLYEKRLPTEMLIKKFSLDEKKNDYMKNLSGGQVQRVALACAVVNDPDIVFLDEPTTGLDPQARRNLWDEIKLLKEEGKTVVLTTHYMEEAEALADYVYIIDHGNIIAKGTVNQLIESLEESSVVAFEIEQEDFDPKNVFKEDVELIDGHYEVRTDNVEKSLAKLFQYTRENEVRIANMGIRKPNLEDVFLSLTGRKLRE